MLGLDNAATPLGLKAMRELQELNETPDRASNEQILFLVINTSAVTVVPVTIFTYRAQQGAADPTDVFLPILIATFCSTLVGLIVTAAVQRLRLFQPVVLAYRERYEDVGLFENEVYPGIADMLDELVAAGHDPQLEQAVDTAMELLKTQEVKLLPQPADPVRAVRPE